MSPDALALVRFGLRAADDPRILNTVRVIDALLKVDLPAGPCWHRYNDDGYGEHEDGRPFDGTGVGRAWPLLTGERAHYELAAGNRVRAEASTSAGPSRAASRYPRRFNQHHFAFVCHEARTTEACDPEMARASVQLFAVGGHDD